MSEYHNTDPTNNLPAIYREEHSTFYELHAKDSFISSAPVEDWMTEGMEPYYTTHTLLSAGKAQTPQGNVHVMVYAQRREPLPHQAGSESYINFWRSYNIESLNPATGEYIAYTYHPKEYATSPIPEEVGVYKRLTAQQAQDFMQGTTFWHNAGSKNDLTQHDILRLRGYLEQAQYDPDLTKKMVDMHRTRWPKSYRPGERPKDPMWKTAGDWMVKKILGD